MTAPANPKGVGGDAVARRAVNAPFVASLRARPDTVRVAGGGNGSWMVRAQMPEVWDAVRFEITPGTPVMMLKQAALAELQPDAGDPDQFVVKLNGIEVLDEEMSIADAGALNGSTFLITYRRRRPVR